MHSVTQKVDPWAKRVQPSPMRVIPSPKRVKFIAQRISSQDGAHGSVVTSIAQREKITAQIVMSAVHRANPKLRG